MAANNTALDAALSEVQHALCDLLSAGQDQYCAVAVGDLTRLEAVTARQERLARRLHQAESVRRSITGAVQLPDYLESLPGGPPRALIAASSAIADLVTSLQQCQVRNANLVRRATLITGETLQFLQRLVQERSGDYNNRSGSAMSPAKSLLLDGRA